jgi:hypothetical protein
VDIWIQLALSLTLAGGLSVASAPAERPTRTVHRAAASWHRHVPPASSPAALGQLRFGRRLAGPRVERGAAALVTRSLPPSREGWSSHRDPVETRHASCHLAASAQRGPPIAG